MAVVLKLKWPNVIGLGEKKVTQAELFTFNIKFYDYFIIFSQIHGLKIN